MLLAVQKLAPERAYGSAVQALLEEVTGEGVALGAIYTTLYRLEEKGFLRSEKSEPEPVRGGRSKRLYHLQGLGERALQTTDAMRARFAQVLALRGAIA